MTVRQLIGLFGALVVCGILLALPIPAPPDPAVASAQRTVAEVWPAARQFTLPAVLPDGSTFRPITIVDPDTAVGLATSADGTQIDFVVVRPDAAVRVLQTFPVTAGDSVDAVAVTADRLFWMRTDTDQDGHAQAGLYAADRAGDGPAELLSADVGQPVFYDSAYDLQVVSDRLVWAATPAGARNTEVRSIALAGGSVEARGLVGSWAMSAWPWLSTGPAATGASTVLFNLNTQLRVPVKAPANQQLSCSPTWCRMLVGRGAQAGTNLIRPNGAGRIRISVGAATAIATDVALLDRFEVLATPTSAKPTPGTGLSTSRTITTEKVALYDLAHRRGVQIAGVASDAGARGHFLWWATGDNETLAWHVLDLSSLR